MATALAPLLTLREASDIAHVSISTLRREIRRGTLKAYRLGKRHIRISPVDLQRWIEDGAIC
jgi:excisionase family DNA binding protein